MDNRQFVFLLHCLFYMTLCVVITIGFCAVFIAFLQPAWLLPVIVPVLALTWQLHQLKRVSDEQNESR